ncbi:hypothetical protein Tco_1268341, partial [Tanacetum coccineum]
MASTITLNYFDLFFQTLAILNANPLHFITLSLLFLPLTFYGITAYQFYLTTNFIPVPTPKTEATFIAVIIPALIGVALITYSTLQAIHRTPLTFTCTVKSLSRSFIPLLSTFIAGSLQIISLALIIIKLCGLIFHVDALMSMILNGLFLIILYYVVSWGSAPAIVVSESRLRFEALRQSERQSYRFRFNSYLILWSAFVVIKALVSNTVDIQNMESVLNWISVVQLGVNYMCSLLMIVYYVAANTVLYVQCCKVARGERLDDEVFGQDVRLLLHG